MAIVPRAQNEVALQPATDAKLIPADAGPGIGSGLAQFGQGLAQASQASAAAAEQKAQAEAVMLDNQHMGIVQKLHASILTARGMNATQALADASDQLRDANSAIMAQASNRMVRDALQRNIGTRTADSLEQWTAYANGQAREAGDQALVSHADGLSVQALHAPQGSPEESDSIAGGVHDIQQLGQRQGWDDATVQTHILQYRSSYHAQRFNQIYQGDGGDVQAEQANSYLDAHMGEMTPEDINRARETIRMPLQRNLVQSRTSYILQQPGVLGGGSAGGSGPQPTGPTAQSVFQRAARAHETDGVHMANPDSSARGPYQFVEQTWLGLMHDRGAANGYGAEAAAIQRAPNGQWFVSDPAMRSRILNLQAHDSTANEAMIRAASSNYSAALTAAHLPDTPANLYLAHWFGPQMAVRMLQMSPDTPVDRLIGAHAAHINNLDGKTVGDAIASTHSRVSAYLPANTGTVPPPPGQTASGPAPTPPPGNPSWSSPVRVATRTVPGGQFGAPRAYGTHQAHDYAGMAPGTPVYPMAPGVILNVGHTMAGGNTVVIDYGGGYRSTYLHLTDGSTANLQIGQHVDPNTVVGGVGATGTAAHGVHLHAELVTPNGPVDPTTMAGHVFEGGQAIGPNAHPNGPQSAWAPDGTRVDLGRAYAAIEAMPWSESMKNMVRDEVRLQARESDAVVARTEHDSDNTLLDTEASIGQGGGHLTDVSQLPTDAWQHASPAMRERLVSTMQENQHRLAEEAQRQRQAQEIADGLSRGAYLDQHDEHVQHAVEADFTSRWQAYTQANPNRTVGDNSRFIANYVNLRGFVPHNVVGIIEAQLRSNDPNAQLAAAQHIAAIQARVPTAVRDFSEEGISRANRLLDYVNMGATPQEAIQRVAQEERQPATETAAVRQRFTQLTDQNSRWDPQKLVRDAFGMDVPTRGGQQLVADYRHLVENEFVRNGGNLTLAQSTAGVLLHRRWGVSNINGSATVMRTPPEAFYSVNGMSPEDNGRWMREQAVHELIGNGIAEPDAADRLQIIPDVNGRTVNGRPVYNGVLPQPNGTDQILIDDRGRPMVWVPNFATSPEYQRLHGHEHDALNVDRAERARWMADRRNLPSTITGGIVAARQNP